MSDKLYEMFREWVKARQREGYTEDDIKVVVNEWKDCVSCRNW